MTIIPLPLTPNPETDPDFFRPLPEAWCYRCAMQFVHANTPDGYDCTIHARPDTPYSARNAAAFAAREVLAVPDLLRDWHPAHVEAVRALAAELLDVVAIAEQVVQRRAS